MNSTDEKWMRAAIEVALQGKGWTSPRPSVGCVLVREGAIIGAGHTQPGDGNPHAEVMAVRESWRQNQTRGARGATAYTTLEPCAHWGTTPPCCDLLVREGIKRVVVGVVDPDPRVAGRGLKRMNEAGLEIEVGVLTDKCFASLDEFLYCVVGKRPFVTLKSALSLDGNIALDSGESKWITGAAARAKAHELRHYHDAITVGIGTVLADDPQLSVRLENEAAGLAPSSNLGAKSKSRLEEGASPAASRHKQPTRIVLDGDARTPLGAKLWQDAPGVIIICRADAPARNIENLKSRGAKVWPLADDWPALMQQLWRDGIYSVLIEGGARVAASAFEAGVIDKVALFIAPILMGDGQRLLPGVHFDSMSDVSRLERVCVSRFGVDTLIEGYLREP